MMDDLLNQLSKFWLRATEPDATLSQADQRQARLLSGLLIAFFPLIIVATFIGPLIAIINGEQSITVTRSSVVALVIIIVIYVISRTRYYRLAAISLVAGPVLAVALPAIISGDPAAEIAAVYLSLGVVFASFLLGDRETAIAGVVTVIAIFLMPPPTIEKANTNLTGVAVFIVVITAMMLIANRMRQAYVVELETVRNELREQIAVVKVTQEELERRSTEIAASAQVEQTQRQQLQDVLGEIVDLTAMLNQSALDIQAATSQQLANVNQQDATVTDTVITVEEMRATITQTAERAQRVAEASRESLAVSDEGEVTLQHTLDGMNAISQQVGQITETIVDLSQQTQQIGEIIETVSGLAEQSKLLALNASIEAARAGKNGRGFAVVAAEVRQLAEQSREATARVRHILSQIQTVTGNAVAVTQTGSQSAHRGVQLAEDVGAVIRKLAATLEESAEAATQIAASTQQQRNGMDQLVAAMESIRQASTQTASSTQQTDHTIQAVVERVAALEASVAGYSRA